MKKTNIVGNNIRRLRMKVGLNQEELALESGLSQGYINQLENGKRRYTQKSLELIAKTLSVPMGELFVEENSQHISSVRHKFDICKMKPLTKSRFITLINDLPKHIVEHYFTLMTIEREILKNKLSFRNSKTRSHLSKPW